MFSTGYENPSVADGGIQQNTYEDIVDEPRQKLQKHPIYQNQNTTERPIPLTELALYINQMTKTKDGFKKDFEVRWYNPEETWRNDNAIITPKRRRDIVLT